MKKSLWMFLVLGLAFAVQGCGFDPTIDSSVMIVKVTPTRLGWRQWQHWELQYISWEQLL